MRISAEAARRFLVAQHFLAPARSWTGGPGAVLQVFRRLGSIQFDPISVAGRNHDLVLHARVASYEPSWCDLLYERRDIFEGTNKALSLIPASEFPWYRQGLGRKGTRHHAAVLTDNPRAAERVVARIRAEGALSARDFEPEHAALRDWFGMPENVVRALLEAYTVEGVLGLARRGGNLRYYDLLERLLPADLFDSLLWDKALIASLFDFDYVWERFFPPVNRRWGRYVLPIAFGGRFVGRIEPRIRRDKTCVEVLGAWWENDFTPGRADGFVDAMGDALNAYLTFAGADRLEWAPHLTTEQQLFPIRR